MQERGGANILIVEDSVDDLLLTQRALRKAGVHASVRVCEDGEDGMRQLETVPLPSLILLDWKLPRRSGAEVLAWIRKHPELRDVPVIVVSSSRLPEDIEAARAAGARAFLEKPLRSGELVQQLDALGLSALRTAVSG